MKVAHLIGDDKSIACKKMRRSRIYWDVSIPDAPICKTCFNYYSKSGDYFMACIDHPFLVDITSIQMSKINMMSV